MISFLKIEKKRFKDEINFYKNESHSASIDNSTRFKYIIHIIGSINHIVLIKKRRWLTHYYEVVFSNNDVFEIKSFGGFKSNYVFQFNEEKYFLYVHKGLLVSIFLNTKQIGLIRKEKKAFNNQIVYEIVTNDDANLPIIYSLALMLHDSSISVFDETSDVAFDFGNIGPEEFPFDFNWKPSINKG